MFVTELDRPWTDTDFMYQGFLITTKYQLKKLRKNCSYVIVSVERSSSELFPDVVRAALSVKQQDTQHDKLTTTDKIAQAPAHRKLDPTAPGFFAGIKQIVKEVVAHRDHVSGLMNSSHRSFNIEMSHDEIVESSIKRKQANEIKELRRGFTKNPATQPQLHTYKDSVPTPVEMPLAFIAKQDISEVALILAREMELPELKEQIDSAKELMSEVVDSIIRNENAMQLVSYLRKEDDYAYKHSIDVALKLIIFGRHLGLPPSQLNSLGMGGLLHDIGRIKLPENFRQIKDQYSPPLYNIAKEHVQLGVELLENAGDLPATVIRLISRHHERYDGSGYPEGLQGERIGLFASMAAIVDHYCAITSNQPHKPARTSAEAVKILIEERGKAFHPGLVDQFLQAVGVYPVGTLVKMNTQDIGIVIRQNPMWRLKPVVMLIIGPDGKRLFKPTTVDLLYTTSDSKGTPYKIVSELLPDAYGIDMREYFIHE